MSHWYWLCLTGFGLITFIILGIGIWSVLFPKDQIKYDKW